MAATDSKVHLKVKVISPVTQRFVRQGPPSFCCDVIDDQAQTVKTMFLPENHTNQIKENNHYLIRNIISGEYHRLTEKSIIMECGPFKFPNEVEENFKNPPVMTVEDALASPKKRRMSISGILQDASETYTTGMTKRKHLKITDKDHEICIKLWGRKTDMHIPEPGTSVSVSCITIAEYGGNKEGNSTSLTEITEHTDKTDFQGTVEAISFEGDIAKLVFANDQKLYQAATTLVQEFFPELTFKENVQLMGTCRGTELLELKKKQE